MRITREAVYVEEVDAEIVADTRDEAEGIAEAIGNGEQVDWPVLHRYNTHLRESVEHRLLSYDFGDEKDVSVA